MKFLQKLLSSVLAWSVFVFVFPVRTPALPRTNNDSEEKINIVLLDLKGMGISAFEAENFSDYLRSELAEIGISNAMEPDHIKEIQEKSVIENGKCYTDDCALEIGKLLEASHIILGSIEKTEHAYDLNFRILNIETGTVQKSINDTYQGDEDDLKQTLRHLVIDMTESTQLFEHPPKNMRQLTTTKNGKNHVPSTANNLWMWMKANREIVLVGLGAVVVVGTVAAIINSRDDSSANEIDTPPTFPP